MLYSQTLNRVLDSQKLARVRACFSSDDVDTALEVAALELNEPSVDELLQVTANTLGLHFLEVGKATVDESLLSEVPSRLIHRHSVFPVARHELGLVVAVENPFNIEALDALDSATETRVLVAVARPAEIRKLIKSHFGVGAETIDGLMAQEQAEDVESLEELEFDQSEDSALAQEASVVRLVNEILSEAIESRASDIHIEAQETNIKIRYRIDGVLQRQPTPPAMNRFYRAIVSRLKIMAKLNIAEKRVPQDGRIKLRVKGREVDIRVSIIPMLHGEGVVMRVLDRDNLSLSLRGIGMSEEVYANFSKLITLPHGIILVTGPTGSGKTTTLYSSLSEIKNEDIKIITTEDPIEYQLEGINQIQVNNKVGLTFAASLRSILRHDPDVCLVGEIRDLETAENAVQASLTGHLVFSTLHTNDAASAFTRLCDMGVEPFLASSTVEGIMAQRLVRRLCKHCRAPLDIEAARPTLAHDLLPHLNEDTVIYEAVGCRECRSTGYAGRMGVYELMVVDDEIRNEANERIPSNILKRLAVKKGMTTLRQDGWSKVVQGITTIDEVLRVTKED